MNLAKLFELQRQLDEHIEKEHPRQEGEDRLAKKILALFVELGELCNCWRGFKYWSNNQKPKGVVYETCKYCEGRKMLGFRLETCWYCGGTGLQVVERPLLEEYVDCLHFILSIGLDITDPELIELREIDKAETITEQFIMIFDAVGELYEFEYEHWDYESLLIKFVDLGEMLGFTWKQIEEAYLRKNAVNHQRQEMGY
ncbi:dUTP diphosphatase [Geobacillus thermodenitrificans]|uniref:dUTP diphosphatase n=1 Tax=Geobacillus thermodenitrificans TaxID=33940 RepID=UPI002E1FF058|nr:dUTP diphosphatase [Geobacillus thermodenitrificans]